MRKAAFILALLVVPTASSPLARPPLTVTIDQPADGGLVDQQHTVSGTVSNPRATVWVVVHPTRTSGYWVQPRVAKESDGTWSVYAYFGREGMDQGAPFEVRAVANPRRRLAPGELDYWPAGAAQSRVVRVTRR